MQRGHRRGQQEHHQQGCLALRKAVAAAETLQQVQAEARRQETRGALEQGGDAHPGQAAVLVGIGRPGAVEHRGRQRRQPRVVGALRESAHRMILCCT